jgi:hypothetical protein
VEVGRISFEDPWAGLVALVAILPLVAAVVSARRSRRVARALGLVPDSARAAPATAAAVIACLALAVATARPVLEEGKRPVRADSEVVFVVDVSRSMLAASSPSAPTRLERARAAVLRLRSAVPSVPAGVAGLTDRVLPYSFPSADRASFAEVIAHSVQIESPPPTLGGGIAIVATSLEALTELDRGFFSEGIGRRACVVLTDGESQSFTETPEGRTCAFLFIRVGGADERVFGEQAGRRLDAGYRPDPSAGATLERLAAASGGRVWPLTGLDDAANALREAVDAGPTTSVRASSESQSLAPYPAGLALVLTAVLAIGTMRRRRVRSAELEGRPSPRSR